MCSYLDLQDLGLFLLSVVVLAKTLWGEVGPRAPSGGAAIISSWWKNWGEAGQKVRGPRHARPRTATVCCASAMHMCDLA